MHVLMVTSDYLATQSGIGAHVQFLTEELRQLGVQVTVAGSPILDEDAPTGGVLRFPQIGPPIVWHEQGGDALVGGMPAPEWSVVRQTQLNLALVAGIDRSMAFDLVHLHSFRAAPAAIALAQRLHTPLIASRHDPILTIPTTDGRVRHGTGGWSLVSGWSDFALEYVRAVDRYALEQADRVISVSEALRSDLTDPAISGKVVVIGNGAKLPPCTPECQVDKPADRVRTIGFAGRLAPQKGIDIAVEAMGLVTNPDVRLRIAGNGGLLDALRARAGELGIADRVEFLGLLDRDALHRFMHQVDMIIAPSRADALPILVCEAQLLGKLVVASDVDGIPEQIRHGDTGLLCPPSDPAALAATIDWALEHETETERIGQAAAEFAAKTYSWTTIAAQTREVYQEVLDGCRPDAAARAGRQSPLPSPLPR